MAENNEISEKRVKDEKLEELIKIEQKIQLNALEWRERISKEDIEEIKALLRRSVHIQENPLQKIHVSDDDIFEELKKHHHIDSPTFDKLYNVSRPTSIKIMKEFAQRYPQSVEYRGGYVAGKIKQPTRIYLKQNPT